jgi:UDP-N-acetylglucosamine 2-epimerase (non-hydrolysing)
MKVAIVVGTRPEIIKMASLVKQCIKRNIPYILIHSNQHYSEDMDSIFFRDLQLPTPHYNLKIGSGKHGNQTGNILIRIEPILESEKPDIVFVQGDTNTTAAAALAASKLGLKVAHIEAGLRSYDKRMPEETNRIMTDHLSDFLFAVTQVQYETLLSEGIDPDKIKIVGNTVTDTLIEKLSETETSILEEIGVQKKDYALVTIHRAGNVDSKESLLKIQEIFENLKERYSFSFVWPIHPRTLKKLEEFQISLPDNIIQLPPQDYLNFIHLQKNARIILTDSGGLQEEACILQVPCVTLRENTERPETVDLGVNKLTGLDFNKVAQAIDDFANSQLNWNHPFGAGDSAEKILDHCLPQKQKAGNTPKKISVVGLGYMGLPFACLLAEAGHRVCGFDIDADKIASLQKGQCPFDEEGMPELLKRALSSERFLTSDRLEPADVFVISVPTPVADKKCDLSYVLKAMESIAKVAQSGNLVILESTVSPGTCRDILTPFFKSQNLNVQVAFCPERAIPGRTLYELVYNDRVVGGMDQTATESAQKLYLSFVKGQIYTTDATTAETVKLLENSFRDVNIALSNEYSAICKDLQINVWEAIRLANKHPRVNILSPGPGVGGHCIAIDSWFLAQKSKEAQLLRLARHTNDQRPLRIADQVISHLTNKPKARVGILGVAYKKNVDDDRESPVKPLVDKLTSHEIEVSYFDPYVPHWNSYESTASVEALDEWSDLLILTTDHDAFKSLKLTTPMIDTRGLIKEDTL